jgi:repressor LexA
MSDDLTPRQRECLAAITRHIDEQGWPPTYRELASALGVTGLQGVAELVGRLEGKGYVATAHGKSRAIKVLKREVQT